MKDVLDRPSTVRGPAEVRTPRKGHRGTERYDPRHLQLALPAQLRISGMLLPTAR